MSKHDINKAYISPFDKFSYKFDREHPLSDSQIEEIEKYKRIFKLRDHPDAKLNKDGIWEKF